MSRVKIFSHDFTAGDGSKLASTWLFGTCPDSSGLEIHSNGANGINFSAEQGNSVEPDTLDSTSSALAATFADAQYAGVKVGVASLSYSPGALVRCDQTGKNDYGCDPVSWTGGLEIFRHDAGSWIALASGGATTPVVNDWLWIEADGDALEAFINSTSQVSVTDSTYASGVPGVYCYDGTNSAIASDMEAGNLFSRRENGLHRRRGQDIAARNVARRIATNPRLFAGV